MNTLLLAVGSHGDVHPFVGLGIRLLARGHRVTVVTNPHFQPMIERLGLGFLPLGTVEDYRRITADPELWHPRRGFNAIARSVMASVPQQYAHVAEAFAASPSDTVVAASSMAIGARAAQEKLGVPLATVHLSPSLFWSLSDTPPMPGLPFADRLPHWVKRLLLYDGLHKQIVDRILGKPFNEWRATLGLPPTSGVLLDYWHSPQLVLAMFPDWYGPPQPDWPKQAHAIGFPLYDERGLAPMSSDLLRFLEAGTPPIAFTPGSAMFHGDAFFAASAEACRLLGRRGLLLSRHAGHIPKALPPGVIHVDYAPFSELLPRCAALVHHGGIGTSAQALQAGVPQLVMPLAHDQPDNARRLKRLGVADAVVPSKYRAKRVARKLRHLLDDASVSNACRSTASKFVGVDALEDACDRIEALVK